MMTVRAVAACALMFVIAGHRLDAQEFSRYRTFDLGSDIASIAALTGVVATEATTVHHRPGLSQDLAWRPSRWTAGSTTDSTDPVEQIVFSFYNDHLFRIVVDYGHGRTEGMTDADMIEAISAVYGPTVKAGVKSAPSSARAQSKVEVESGQQVARWGDTRHAVALYRTSSYREAFRLIVTDLAVADLERKDAMQALRLDEQDAPQREIARQQKEKDDARASAAKARSANKVVFKP